MFGGSSSSSSLLSGGGPSSSSSRAAVSNIIRRFPRYYVSWMMMVMILVSSTLVVQRSESFLIIPTTTTTIRSSRHHPPVIQHNHGHYYFDNVICSSTLRRGGGIAILSSAKQQSSSNTIQEEVKPTARQKRRTWEESFQLLVSYKEQHGNCNVPRSYKEDRRLGNWVRSQRARKDRLRDERIAKLNDLGFLWSNELYNEKWEKMFEKLQEYTEIHGNCIVPIKYKEDPLLGSWVHIQRQGKDKLSDERIDKLDDLGFSWSNEMFEEQWDKMFEKLVLYAELNNGDCNIPYNVDDHKNKDLIKWVEEQRKRKFLLSKERRAKLDKLGLIWEDANKVKFDHKWNEQYERLREYKQKYGHCRVPQKWKDDPALGEWVFAQRQKYRKGQLREDRQMKLEQIDFTWKVRAGGQPDYVQLDLKWLIKFGILNIFLEEHGHCNVPRNYKKDPSLGKWVHLQRANQKYGTLRQDRKEQLDDIGFMWSFNDQRDEQWNEKYQELKTFKDTNGHLRLTDETLRSLIDWASRQRVLFTRGRLRVERKILLDEIDFQWET